MPSAVYGHLLPWVQASGGVAGGDDRGDGVLTGDERSVRGEGAAVGDDGGDSGEQRCPCWCGRSRDQYVAVTDLGEILRTVHDAGRAGGAAGRCRMPDNHTLAHLPLSTSLPRGTVDHIAEQPWWQAQGRGAAGDRYAGIEIGSKGVKAVVIAAGQAGNVRKGIANTTLAQGVAKSGVFSESAIADTAEEAGKFADRIRDEFKVPSEKISIFGSSGLPKATNRDALVQAVTAATKLSPMTFINPADEVKYSIKGLLDSPTDRARALLIDVGSGNTKGGYLQGDGVVDFSIPFGSVTSRTAWPRRSPRTRSPSRRTPPNCGQASSSPSWPNRSPPIPNWPIAGSSSPPGALHTRWPPC